MLVLSGFDILIYIYMYITYSRNLNSNYLHLLATYPNHRLIIHVRLALWGFLHGTHVMIFAVLMVSCIVIVYYLVISIMLEKRERSFISLFLQHDKEEIHFVENDSDDTMIVVNICYVLHDKRVKRNEW